MPVEKIHKGPPDAVFASRGGRNSALLIEQAPDKEPSVNVAILGLPAEGSPPGFLGRHRREAQALVNLSPVEFIEWAQGAIAIAEHLL